MTDTAADIETEGARTRLRPPVVTDIDRLWAAAQCPAWAVRGPAGALSADAGNGLRVLVWDAFVAAEAERFEAHFGDTRRTADDWSRLWRKTWWPKADARRRHFDLVPRSPATCPVFRRGTAEFDRARAMSTPFERMMWDRIGFAQFAPDDPRVARVEAGEPRR